jgi:citrate synthase
VAADPSPAATTATKSATPGVTVVESAISSIDAEGLRYRGYAVEELAARANYETVAWLLLTGAPPDAAQRIQLLADLDAGSEIPAPVWRALAELPEDALPVARLQVALPVLALTAPWLAEASPVAGTRRALHLLGAFATLAGRSSGPAPQTGAPAGSGVAARFLTLLRERPPAPAEFRALDEVLILYADHELNASTFAARVAASTRADLVSCVLAGLSALRGQLHGGVDRLVRAMLTAAEEEGVEPALERYRRQGTPLPGFGHAVYRGIDPRAVRMHALARALAPAAGQERWLRLTEEIEEAAGFARLPAANVDLYTPVVYRSLGIPDAMSTLVFALGRMAGWCAHILEQYERNRLIRPRAAYVGPEPRPWPQGA